MARGAREAWCAAETARIGAGLGLYPRDGGRTTSRAKYFVTNQEEIHQSRVAPTHCSRGRTVCLPEGLEIGHATGG